MFAGCVGCGLADMLLLLLLALWHRFYQMTGYGADEVLGHNW
jgi:hypothetical protein